ncbi:MAG: NPCBM/NEW2 domain-containing protein, partial [Planctomycetota bacterium]
GENLARRNQPRRDRGFDGGRLQLGGQSFDKGLALRSRSTMVFRIPKGFNRLVATVGIDDRVRENGHVQLVIQGDSKVIFNEPITGRDRPRELDLDLTGAKRVTVLVDFGEELDVADFLNLCNARFTK